MNIRDTCIHETGFNPFIDTGEYRCDLKEGWIECAYADKWNECPDFKPVRALFREAGLKWPKK
jgi:hypothetical protein